ncbi:MAG: DUF6034 family protein [Oscillospiraceae bacterium]|nr:DUF6034 family protein [Oscillospiraceae bacterium]
MKHIRFPAAALALLSLVSCTKNPDSDIIVHKDVEKLIEEAKQTDEYRTDVSEFQTGSRYFADYTKENLGVSVHADAEIVIPDIDQLSMYRVQQRRFTQEDCDRVRMALMGDVPLSDCTKIMQIRTKAEIEEMIAERRQMIQEEKERIANDPEYAALIAENTSDYLADKRQSIERLQADYDSAPEFIDYAAYASDGTLERNTDRIAQEEDKNGFWHSYCRDITEGDTLWACSQDGTAMIHAQNGDAYSNVMWFSKSSVGYENCGAYIAELQPFSSLRENMSGCEILTGETANLSRTDAEAQAEAFLAEIGADDFICCEGERLTACETLTIQKYTDFREKEKTFARTYWVLRYYRSIGGVPIEQPSGTKKTEEAENGKYEEKMWPAEVIELRINDSGIVRMQWNAPLSIMETVVENAAVKPFDEIAEICETMLPMTAANTNPEMNTQIQINRVTLSYSRISEKNDFKTGLIVPVWAFYGSRKVTADDYYDQHESFTGVQLALNGIDGSVIDSELGY